MDHPRASKQACAHLWDFVQGDGVWLVGRFWGEVRACVVGRVLSWDAVVAAGAEAHKLALPKKLCI